MIVAQAQQQVNAYSNGLDLLKEILEGIKNPKVFSDAAKVLKDASAFSDDLLAQANAARTDIASVAQAKADLDAAIVAQDDKASKDATKIEKASIKLAADKEALVKAQADFAIYQADAQAAIDAEITRIADLAKTLVAKETSLNTVDKANAQVVAGFTVREAALDTRENGLDARAADITAREDKLRAALS